MHDKQTGQGFRSFRVALMVFIKHYRHAPLQASAILLGITLAVTLFVGVQAINANAKRSYSESSEQLSARATYQIVPPSGQRTFSESVYYRLRANGVSQILPVIEGRVIDKQGRRWSVQGSDLMAALTSMQTEPRSSSPNSDSRFNRAWASQIPLGRMLAGEPIVLVSQAGISQSGQWSLDGLDVEVITLDESSGLGNRILMDISLAQRILNRPGQLSYIAFFAESLPSSVELSLEQQARVIANQSGEDLEALTDSFHLNLTAMSLLAFLVGLFIAYNGVRYSLLKRDRLLMQLQHVGVRKKALFFALIVELVLLVSLGSIMGFVLGLQLSYWLHPLVAVTLEQLYSATLLPGDWKVSWLLQATGLSLVSALLACSAQFVQMVNTPLSRSVGYYQMRDSRLQFARLFRIGLVVVGVAIVGIAISSHYRFTLLNIGLLVVGVPMLLPTILHALIGQLIKRDVSGLKGYAIAEAKELIAPLSLAMMAMLLAVSSNIAINTLVGSFESTLRGWLDGRLHADLYVSPSQDQSLSVLTYLQQNEQVNSVYQQTYLSGSYQGLLVNIATKDEQTLRQTSLFKQALPNVWQGFFKGQSVLISEPMAIKLDKQIGETIKVPFLDNRSLRIGGVFYDYGNPKGEIIISPWLWNELGFTQTPSSYGVSIDGDLEAFSQQLRDDLLLSEGQLIDQQRLKQLAIAIFSQTFAITQALNVLTLLVAAIGLFTACYLISQAREAAVAKLFSLGVRRGAMRTMLMSQMMLLVGLTCVVAMPVGYVLGRLLTENITLQAFGWTLFFEWDWLKVLLTVSITLVVSAIATWLPLFQQTRKPLLTSLQSEVL